MLLFCAVANAASAAEDACQRATIPRGESLTTLPPAPSGEQFIHLQGLASQCADAAAVLAELAFWGETQLGVARDLSAFRRYADLAKGSAEWLGRLRLLRAADEIVSAKAPAERLFAVQQFNWELLSDSVPRRQYALAVLNELRWYVPVVRRREGGNSWGLLVGASGSSVLSMDKGVLVLGDADTFARTDTRPAAVYFPADHLAGNRQLRQWSMPQGRQIGRLYTVYPDRSDGHCTVTRLNAQWLLTAAHCLFAASARNTPATSLYYYPSPLSRPLYRVAVEQAWVLPNHHRDLLSGNVLAYTGRDLALLKIAQAATIAGAGDDSEGRSPMILELAVLGREATDLVSYSYPSDKQYDSLWLSQCASEFYGHMPGAALAVHRLDCDNSRGQSGAAVSRFDGAIVGVLSARVRGGEGGVGTAIAAFTPAVLADIKQIVQGQLPENMHWQVLGF